MDGILCFKDKTGENIPFKNGFYFKSLDSWESEIDVSRAKPPKIFASKTGFFQKFGFLASAKSCFKDKTAENISFENGRRQEKTRDFDYMVFGHF